MPIRLPTPRLITSRTPIWRWLPEAQRHGHNLVRLCFDDWMGLNLADRYVSRRLGTRDLKLF